MSIRGGTVVAGSVFIIAWVAARTNLTIGVVTYLLVAGVSYVASLYLHPNTNCQACAGTAKHRGAVFTYSHRPCRRCGGTGRKMRWGYRTFTEEGRRKQRALNRTRK